MSFLSEPPHSKLYDDDVEELGYVMNVSRIWGHHPELCDALFAQLGTIVRAYGLGMRERGILVAACASAFGDSYCSLAWGNKLAAASDEETAAGVLTGKDVSLSASERAMASWARKVARDPNATTQADVQELRDAGFDDRQILGITLFVGLRIAFSTVNDALGAQPDAALRTTVPQAVLDAVSFGRPIA